MNAYDILANLDTHNLALIAGVLAYLVACDDTGAMQHQWATDWQFAIYGLIWSREVPRGQ